MKQRIGLNNFVRRQVKGSRFSYFYGSWQRLLNLCNDTINETNTIKEQDGVVLLKVDPKDFYTGLVQVSELDNIVAKLIKRQENEASFINVTVLGAQQPAKFVEIVLYSYDRLRLNNEQSTECDWEIICINAYPTSEASPMTPLTMARNYLDLEGGTKSVYTAEEFAKSIVYWSTHAMVDPVEPFEKKV